jgi:iron complex outermembrane receptor protein
MNQAGAKTRGVDLNLTANIKDGANSWVANFDGTYTSSYKSRFSASDPWTELVGSFGDAIYGYDLHVRWKHQASLTWSRGDWSVTGVQAFTGHYRDEVDGFGSGVTSPNAPTWVKSYTLYHLSATYTGFKDTSVTFGVKNLFDTKPSYSAHNVDNVVGAGWDGRVGDRGCVPSPCA